MKSLVIIFSMFLALNVTAKTPLADIDYSTMNIEYVSLENEMFDLEQEIFEDSFNIDEEINVSDINVIELEEEVEMDFDVKNYLPLQFNAYEGMHKKECI